MSISDDRDSKVVLYSNGDWQPDNTYPNAYHGTLTFTGEDGATASVSFYGTKIKVVGFLISNGRSTESSYRIDDGPTTTFSAPVPAFPENNRVFYESPLLTLGPHTLLITNKRKNGLLYLDYYEISSLSASASPTLTSSMPSLVSTVAPEVTTSANPTSTVASVSASNAPASAYGTAAPLDATHSTYTQRYSHLSGQQSTVIVTVPTDATGSGSSGVTSATSNAKAIVIGGILSGVIFLLLMTGLGVFFWRRRRICRMAPSSMFRAQYPTRLPDDPLSVSRY